MTGRLVDDRLKFLNCLSWPFWNGRYYNDFLCVKHEEATSKCCQLSSQFFTHIHRVFHWIYQSFIETYDLSCFCCHHVTYWRRWRWYKIAFIRTEYTSSVWSHDGDKPTKGDIYRMWQLTLVLEAPAQMSSWGQGPICTRTVVVLVSGIGGTCVVEFVHGSASSEVFVL